MNTALRRYGWTLPPLLAVVVVGAASLFVKLPRAFDYSDPVIWGCVALALALGLGLMQPERWLYSETARLAHAFKEHHGVSDDRAEVALTAVAGAHDAASRLRSADNGFRDDLAEEVSEAADRLDDVARLVFYKPEELPKYQALIIRSESVVDAIEDHARLRARAVHAGEVDTSRNLALEGLTSLQGAMDASVKREVATILNRIEANVATAEVLLRPRQ